MNALLELLFPPKCMLCGSPLGGDEEVCGLCRQRVLLNTAPPLVSAGAFFDKAAAGLWYEGDVRRAIHGLKYREKQSYARPLARVTAVYSRFRLSSRWGAENTGMITAAYSLPWLLCAVMA